MICALIAAIAIELLGCGAVFSQSPGRARVFLRHSA